MCSECSKGYCKEGIGAANNKECFTYRIHGLIGISFLFSGPGPMSCAMLQRSMASSVVYLQIPPGLEKLKRLIYHIATWIYM